LARLEALLAQHRGDVALAPADPAQRRLRIAADRALDQPFERRQKARLTFNGPLTATATPPDTRAQLIAASLQFVSVRPSTSAISSSRMICSLFDWQIKNTLGATTGSAGAARRKARFGGRGTQPLGFQFQGKSSPMRLIG
jgi:hypothetical protein